MLLFISAGVLRGLGSPRTGFSGERIVVAIYEIAPAAPLFDLFQVAVIVDALDPRDPQARIYPESDWLSMVWDHELERSFTLRL